MRRHGLRRARWTALALMGASLFAPGLLLLAPSSVRADDAGARAAFERLDRNRDDVIAFDEFVRASDERLQAMDRNGDGDIGQDEFLAHHEAQTRRRADALFAALDADRDGRLAATELAGRSDRAALLGCDADGDGAVTRDEYLACRRRAAERWMRRIWAKYDSNGDGFIGRDERVAALRDFFARLDADGDGRVDRGEFAAAHQRWLERRRSGAAGGFDEAD